MKKRVWRRWLFCFLPAVIAAGMYVLLPRFPGWTERFIARGLFRAVAFPLEWVVSLAPFSVTEAVVVLAIPAVVLLLGVWIWRICRRPNRRRTVERGCRFIVWCVSLALLLFMVMDGGNFSRDSLGKLMDLPQRRYTPEELCAVTADLAQRASAARLGVAEDADGCMTLSASVADTLANGKRCYAPLREKYPYFVSGTWRVKGVLLSHWWSYTGYTGVYCPWLGEASVNVDVPPSELGHTVAHELAHTMGFAKEDECNFIAYLACITGGDPDYVYSGYLAAYLYCANALYRYDPALWKEAYSHCSPGVVRDLRQRNAYWDAFEGKTMQSSQRVNDAFIKANGVKSGTLSYNQMVSLVLRYYDQQGWLNTV